MTAEKTGAIPQGRDARQHVRCDIFDTARATIGGKVHKCSVVNLSIGGAAIIFDVDLKNPPAEGTAIFLDIDGIGELEGNVVRKLDDGMVVRLNVNEEKQDKLALVMMQALNNLFF